MIIFNISVAILVLSPNIINNKHPIVCPSLLRFLFLWPHVEIGYFNFVLFFSTNFGSYVYGWVLRQGRKFLKNSYTCSYWKFWQSRYRYRCSVRNSLRPILTEGKYGYLLDIGYVNPSLTVTRTGTGSKKSR
jgi:hypothetical protein